MGTSGSKPVGEAANAHIGKACALVASRRRDWATARRNAAIGTPFAAVPSGRHR
jgi:hypothetical protein